MLERAGAPDILGLKTHDYGDTVLWVLVGLGLIVVLGLGYIRDPETRAFSRRAFLILGLLFFSGGILDALRGRADSMTGLSRYIFQRTVIFEDGGELIFVSLLVALSMRQFYTVKHRPNPNQRTS